MPAVSFKLWKVMMTVSMVSLLGLLTRPLEVESADPNLSFQGVTQYYQGQPFTGRLLTHDRAGRLRSQVEFRDGMRHGQTMSWYADGQPQTQRTYNRGQKFGVHLGWWENGQERFRYRYRDGVFHGECLEWYSDGSPSSIHNYVAGREVGPQKMWTPDGTLDANYVAIDGQRYGLVKAKRCLRTLSPAVIWTTGKGIGSLLGAQRSL